MQLAKSFGLKVIGSTGSEAKIAYLNSLGVDVPIDYKTQNLREVLQKEGPVNLFVPVSCLICDEFGNGRVVIGTMSAAIP